jgi:hypothetical protein
MFRSRFRVALASFLALSAMATSADAMDLLQRGRSLLDSATKKPSGESSATALSVGEIAAGLRDALKVGTERVVSQVGAADGFNADPEIHIPLPENMQTVQRALGRVGLSSMVDDVELKLNRAAEAAAPRAKQLFWDAIAAMTMDDVKAIYNGPKDAATQYFRRTMSDPLRDTMRPVVDDTLQQVGAIQAYDRTMARYKSLPLVPDVKADLTNHVLDKALDGIFLYLAREEAAIREQPVKRTTDILKKVFGAAS